tara:strand:+ start:738 stop:857 length:120 start_codon:yes stop_codon:yes gene_type:complete
MYAGSSHEGYQMRNRLIDHHDGKIITMYAPIFKEKLEKL